MGRRVRITEENEKLIYYHAYLEIMRPDNTKELNMLKTHLIIAIRNELTEKQKNYMTLYYWNGWSMDAIAKEYGVNKSTVSRTISRARNRLRKILQYTNPKYIPSS